MATERSREVWLDGLKGFAILLVILGHVLSGYLDADTFPEAWTGFYFLRSWIYSFHMPLFFLLSGFTFCLAYCPEGSLKKPEYLRQMGSLLWIYVVFALLQWAVKQAVPALVNEAYTFSDLLKMFWQPLGNFWYLYVLLVFYLMAGLLRGAKLPPLWLLLFGGVAIVVSDCHMDWTHLTWYRILYHLPFFLLGAALCRRRELLKSPRLIGGAVMFLCGEALIFGCFYWYCGYVSMYTRYWGANWRFLIALAESIACLCLFFRCKKISHFPLFRLCGKYCLELYLLHTFFTGGLRTLLPMVGITAPWLSVLVNFILSTGVSLLLACGARRLWPADFFFRPAKFIARLRKRA